MDQGVNASLLLGEQELLALVRALYVVKDNWWLDETEERLLGRLEALVRAHKDEVAAARPRR